MNKRHLVLYLLIALAVIAVLVAIPMREDTDVSFIEDSQSIATSSTSITTPPPDAAVVEPDFRFEIVNTPDAREQGLSGRRELPKNYGMLFIFPTAASYGFWMKDMYVSIDIIWLTDSGRILGIEHSVSPDTYPQSFYPPQPVRYVLETRAGEAERQGWDIGTQIELPLP